MASTLSRSRFDQGCKAYVDAHPNTKLSNLRRYPSGWVWHEHPVRQFEPPSKPIYLTRASISLTSATSRERHTSPSKLLPSLLVKMTRIVWLS